LSRRTNKSLPGRSKQLEPIQATTVEDASPRIFFSLPPCYRPVIHAGYKGNRLRSRRHFLLSPFPLPTGAGTAAESPTARATALAPWRERRGLRRVGAFVENKGVRAGGLDDRRRGASPAINGDNGDAPTATHTTPRLNTARGSGGLGFR
jgi:hypothetical protein